MIACQHGSGNSCGVVLALCGEAFSVSERTCQQCTLANPSRAPNTITVGVALLELHRSRKYDAAKHGFLMGALVDSSKGVGTVLKRKLGWFVRPDETCDCESKAMLMNSWGPDRCQEEFETIIGWLRESANEQKILFVPMVVRGLLRSAIKEVRAYV